MEDLWESIKYVSWLYQGSVGTGGPDEVRDRARLNLLCEARDSILAFLSTPLPTNTREE